MHFFEQNLHPLKKVYTFVSVFHGIRFKVRRLFVVMTSNFFLHPYKRCKQLDDKSQ